jgi:hypothetical protein
MSEPIFFILVIVFAGIAFAGIMSYLNGPRRRAEPEVRQWPATPAAVDHPEPAPRFIPRPSVLGCLVDAEPRTFAVIQAADVRRLTLTVSSAKVTIRRNLEEAENLVRLVSNFPTGWSIAGGAIEELDSFDFDPTAEPFRVYLESERLLGNFEPVAKTRMSYENERLRIDEKSTRCTTAALVLELVVPANFKGDLSVTNNGDSTIAFDCNWSEGDLSLVSEGGDFSGQSLKVANLNIECGSSAAVDFEDISATNCTATMVDGNFSANSLEVTGISDITFSGSGDLDIGKIKGLKTTVTLDEDANTNITLGDVETDDFRVDHGGSGKLNVDSIVAASTTLDMGSNADSVELGTVFSDIFSFDVCGSGDLTVTKLVAAVSANLVLQEDCNCIVKIGELDSAATDINSDSNYGITIDTLKGGSFKGSAGYDCAFELGVVELTGPFDLEQHSSGSSRIAALFSPTVKLYCTDTGSVDVKRMKADVANLKSEGEYGITVDTCKVKALYADALGSGDISVTGELGNWKVRDNDDASVNIYEVPYAE